MSSLTPDQFRMIERLFFEASSRPATEREAFIHGATTDEAVRREVRAMLALGDQAAQSSHVELGIEQLARDAEAIAGEAWIGRQVGACRIDAVLARGGMGIVFRGHDVRLDRPVAIKALSDTLAADTARLQRFRREARIIASLAHPNIAAVFGLEEIEGRQFLVMELLKGPSLAERLRHGPMPIDEALQVGRQVAAAMQAAHDEGVVHRDLKPGNVLFAADGSVKVLDFGLARSDEMSTGFDAAGDALTAMPVTREGLAVGTPGYMSPEQARGQNVDRRTDVFAFGCLLYECLTGKAAFAGDSQVDMLTAVLHREPDWACLPSRTPPTVRRLLERCTAKDPVRRVRDMGDIRLELDDALRDGVPSSSGIVPPALARQASRAHRPALVMAGGLLLALVATLVWLRPQAEAPSGLEPSRHVSRFTIEFPQSLPQRNLSRLGLALSRDGRNLVYFAAGEDGVLSMWRRALDSLEIQAIADTEDGSAPFFSPTGEWVGYIANGVLRKVWLSGSHAIRLHDVHGMWGAHWSDDDRITFVYTWGQPLAQIPAEGGSVRRITTVRAEQGETAHLSPVMLRNGRGVLYTVWMGSSASPRIDVVDLATGKQSTVVDQGCTPRLAQTPAGLHLLWVRRSTLFAAPFDEDRLVVAGPETALVDGVLTDSPLAQANFAVSDEGTLAYVPGPLFIEEMRLAWADLERGAGSTPFNDDRLPFADPRFSADGSRLSLVLRRNAYQGFVYNLERGILERVSTEQDTSSGAIAPDGRHYAYGSNRTGRYTLWIRDLQTGHDRRLVPDEYDFPGFISWAPDGESLVMCAAPDETSSRDIILIRGLDGDTPIAEAFQPSPYHESGPIFSPDGRWLAYASAFSPTDASDREVYLASLPDGRIKRQVSIDGGHSPQWAPDGRTLYYRRSGVILAVEVNPQSGAALGQPRVVWRGAFGQSDPDLTDYAVAPDGRILLVEPSERGHAVDHIHVILNWHRLLERE